jgi:uncharacterized membrane protein YjgN (DUF898 family)
MHATARKGARQRMDTAAGPPVYPFQFTGRTGDYFRIWIVSLCLSILTLGVYSAWGKVRKKRYLYAHTRIAGSAFEFRARPLAILKGRAIAVLLLGGLAATGRFLPEVQWTFIALLLVLAPWIVVGANRFNAQNSAYRNIRFGFTGRIGEAAKVFLGLGALSVVSVGLVYPYYRLRRARFVVGRHRFGATEFATVLSGGDFYAAYILAGLIVLGATITAIVIGILAAFIGSALGTGRQPSHAAAVVPMLFVYAGYLLAFAYLRARVGNLTLNGARIGPLQLSSSLRARDLVWLYFSNIVAIIASVGLATPWATLRLARYRAERLALLAHEPFEALAASPADRASATGSEISDLFDVDVSL